MSNGGQDSKNVEMANGDEDAGGVVSHAFENVGVFVVRDDGGIAKKFVFDCKAVAEYDPEGMSVRLCNPSGATEQEFLVKQSVESTKVGRKAVIFNLDIESIMLKFSDDETAKKFRNLVDTTRAGKVLSVFKKRTEDSSAMQYFQFYGYLSQQQNMMQDFVRTSTYQRAIMSNIADFQDKIVLDVGAGSGILSFFAQQAGAKRVYAVEGSSIAKHADRLVRSNNVDGVIKVISGKVEEIELPEKVDIIVSEPMGYMLLNERMLETYLHAKKWLKPEGKCFPSRGDLHVAPFMDENLYMEQIQKVNFWFQEYFHGINLSSLRDEALKEYFRQPIVDTFDIRICLAKSQRHIIDFEKAHETELHRIEIPLEFHIFQSGTVHGLAFWFDVAFIGSTSTVWLSTAPTEPLTHWYQVRCLLEQPIIVKQGQMMSGRVLMVANAKQSYDVTIECQVVGTPIKSSNTLDLKNPFFRYTGVAAPVPTADNTSPSESYWTQVDMQGAREAVNLVNGVIVDGLGHVSLENGPVLQQQPIIMPAHANIHQGSITSTGRKDARQVSGMGMTTTAAHGGSGMQVPMSAPNSLQMNQLIGGAVAPNLMAQHMSMATASAAGHHNGIMADYGHIANFAFRQ